MGFRDKSISDSIYKAIFNDIQGRANALRRILTFFSFFNLALARYKAELFKQLRNDIWKLDEAEYKDSFSRKNKEGKKKRLNPVGDLGYSGSVGALCSFVKLAVN